MTNEEKEESGQIPPKIKLKSTNGQSAPQEETDLDGKPVEAKPIPVPKSDTSKVDIPQDEIDKNKPMSGNDETMRVILPRSDDIETGTLRKKGSDKPGKTIVIKRSDALKSGGAQEEPSNERPARPEQAKTIIQARPVAKPKEDTSRVDISKAQLPPSQEQVETAKADTMEVILEEISGKGDTGKVEAGPKPPRTVRIKRSDVADFESKTVAETEEKKSATAKLDLPDTVSQQPGGKKTIRIKRSGVNAGMAAGKTLKISRPESLKATPLPTIAEEGRASIEAGYTEDKPHIIFTIAAMITVIISGVLIYLMCTQMPFGASLPWPGKIITEWQGSSRMI